MPRPERKFTTIRRVVRRRHRTWMLSMTLATLGWGTVWLTVVLLAVAPAWAPGVGATYTTAGIFALCGIACGLFTIRAKLAWILITLVPLFANGSLLLLPLIVPDPTLLLR
jgi:hypothetical protein